MTNPAAAYSRGGSCKNLIEYGGYTGIIEFDSDAGVFYGEVINLRDVITFYGESVSELRQAMKDSVDDYLEFCAERGEEPEKPYSGNFVVRIAPELHRSIAVRSKIENKSLNQWVMETLEKAIV